MDRKLGLQASSVASAVSVGGAGVTGMGAIGGTEGPRAIGPSRSVAQPEINVWDASHAESVEASFFARRDRPAELDGAVLTALDDAGVADQPRWSVAGLALADAVRSADRRLAYHNLHHAAEVVLVMGWLCGLAHRAGALPADMAALGVIAMVGHDLAHDGSPPNGGAMEAWSAARSRAALSGRDLDGLELAVIEDVILATDPARAADNVRRATGAPWDANAPPPLALLRAMANEADIAASFLPRLGPHLAGLLAAEWRAGGHAGADTVEGDLNRLAFLRRFDRFTWPSRELGLAGQHARELAAVARRTAEADANEMGGA